MKGFLELLLLENPDERLTMHEAKHCILELLSIQT
jgi:hypothetical protein